MWKEEKGSTAAKASCNRERFLQQGVPLHHYLN
jgi:hypothetical protein